MHGAAAPYRRDETPTVRALSQAFAAADGAAVLQAVPFSSERKWSAAQAEGLGSVVLGAPERLLSGQALTQAQTLASEGCACWRWRAPPSPLSGETLPEGLIPLALLCLRDALRPNVQKTVRYFGEQGVALKVISGDNRSPSPMPPPLPACPERTAWWIFPPCPVQRITPPCPAATPFSAAYPPRISRG